MGECEYVGDHSSVPESCHVLFVAKSEMRLNLSEVVERRVLLPLLCGCWPLACLLLVVSTVSTRDYLIS